MMTEQNIQQTSEVYLKIIDQVKEKMLSGNIICSIEDLESLILDEYRVIIREGLNTLANLVKSDNIDSTAYQLLYKQVFHYIEDMLQYRDHECFVLSYVERGLTLEISAYSGYWHFEICDIKNGFNESLQVISHETKNNVIQELMEKFITIHNSDVTMNFLDKNEGSVKAFINTWLKIIEKEK